MKYRVLGAIIFVFVLTAGLLGAADEKPLSNADIIKLSKLALGDEVIIAKIKTAKEVKFDTSTDDLIKLKQSGVSSPVIAAMLDRSASGGVQGTPSAKGRIALKVVLAAKEGTIDLKPMAGALKTSVGFGMRRYIEYSEITSKIRIKDHAPTLLLPFDRDPDKIWWLVKLKPWNEYKIRVLDLQSMGMFGGTFSSAPDESCLVPYTAKEEKPGLWRISTKGELQPGEYGLFKVEVESEHFLNMSAPYSLFDFGID